MLGTTQEELMFKTERCVFCLFMQYFLSVSEGLHLFKEKYILLLSFLKSDLIYRATVSWPLGDIDDPFSAPSPTILFFFIRLTPK